MGPANQALKLTIELSGIPREVLHQTDVQVTQVTVVLNYEREDLYAPASPELQQAAAQGFDRVLNCANKHIEIEGIPRT